MSKNKIKISLVIIILMLNIIVASVEVKADQGKYDPRDMNMMTEVKNQEEIGVCWDFGGTATLESYLKLHGYGEFDFSEEDARWWTSKEEDGTGWDRFQDLYGWQETMIGYLVRDKGILLEEDMPYRSVNFKTEINDELKGDFNVSDIVFLTSDMDEIKNAIKKYGAVCARYLYDSQYESEDRNAYYCNSEFDFLDGHIISIVGWDDNYARENFNNNNMPSKNGAWLVKNSWGPYNFENGYVWISYEDKYILKTDINYAIMGIKSIKNRKIYEYDKYGAISVVSMNDFNEYVDYRKISGANVYEFNDKYNCLESVTFMTDSVGAEYEISYCDSKTIDQGGFNGIVIGRGNVQHKGYTTAQIENCYTSSGKGAIVLTIDYKTKDEIANIGCEIARGLDYVPRVNEGESYIILDGTPIDTMEYNPINFTIKVSMKKSDKVKIDRFTLGELDLLNFINKDNDIIVKVDTDMCGSNLKLNLKLNGEDSKIISIDNDKIGTNVYDSDILDRKSTRLNSSH